MDALIPQVSSFRIIATITGGADQRQTPSVPALQAEYEKLQEQKESLYADYGKLQKQVQEYYIIRRNTDCILQAEKQLEREGKQSSDNLYCY